MRVEQAVQVIPSIGISIFLKLGGVKVIPSYVDILNNRIIGTGMSAIVSVIYWNKLKFNLHDANEEIKLRPEY